PTSLAVLRRVLRGGVLEQREVLTVTFGDQPIDRNKPERGGVHAKPGAGRRWAVVEQVAEVGVAVRRPHFGTYHEQRAIHVLADVAGLERLGEARPARARVELVERAEQGLAGHDIHVNAGLVVVPVFVPERWL